MPITDADYKYSWALGEVLELGVPVETRNHKVLSQIEAYPIKFHTAPIVSVRKTAVKMALKEMEWFMSGDEKCPTSLLGWWEKQLDSEGKYKHGYGHQMRRFGGSFDQVAFILGALVTNPHSRRLIMTTWHPEEMAGITTTNGNPNTPTTCHGTSTQFFVRNGSLNMQTYQRSADIMLGVPHNWIQYWALLQFFAYHTNLAVGSMRWVFGDLHLYDHPSHTDTANAIVKTCDENTRSRLLEPSLKYEYSGQLDHAGLPKFVASDFSVSGLVPAPIVTTRPELF